MANVTQLREALDDTYIHYHRGTSVLTIKQPFNCLRGHDIIDTLYQMALNNHRNNCRRRGSCSCKNFHMVSPGTREISHSLIICMLHPIQHPIFFSLRGMCERPFNCVRAPRVRFIHEVFLLLSDYSAILAVFPRHCRSSIWRNNAAHRMTITSAIPATLSALLGAQVLEYLVYLWLSVQICIKENIGKSIMDMWSTGYTLYAKWWLSKHARPNVTVFLAP